MRQHSGAPEPKWNRPITRRIFPPDSEKSSGKETKPAGTLSRLVKPPSPSNESASHFLAVYDYIVVEGECTRASHALQSWKKVARRFMQSNKL